MEDKIFLDGSNLTFDLFCSIMNNEKKVIIDLTPEAWSNVEKNRECLEYSINKGKVIYGVTTGFGDFASINIAEKDIKLLQVNLIKSHCCGLGAFLDKETSSGLLLSRIATLARANSGIRSVTLKKMIYAFNHDCIPVIREVGSVGASGDLCPLAHMSYALMGGEGSLMFDENNKHVDALTRMKENGLEPISLAEKEGLAMINGTQFITTLTCKAVYNAEILIKSADLISALTREVLGANLEDLDEKIHKSRPHPGQSKSAFHIRQALKKDDGSQSKFSVSKRVNELRKDRVQNAYSIRCTPQIHGQVYDYIDYAKKVLTTELNSSTDNPMVFQDGTVLSCGNFHGEYPAQIADGLAISLAPIGAVSERRTEQLNNPTVSKSPLPPFLTKIPGLESGYMIPQYTQAALMNEIQTSYVSPATANSIPVSNGKEDHVSMGAWAARKVLLLEKNIASILGIELLLACEALEFCGGVDVTTETLAKIYNATRAICPQQKEEPYHSDNITKIGPNIQKKSFFSDINLLKKEAENTSLELKEVPRPPKGMRDFGPEDMAIRRKVFGIIMRIYEKRGAVEIGTPTMELKKVLTGKYGEEGSSLMYHLQDQGGELLSLRYDQTVPLARYLATNNLTKLKRFQIAPVFRRDNPSMNQGRYREFYQCDYDIVGNYDLMLPDADCIEVMASVLNELDIGGFTIKINNRKILDGIFELMDIPTTLFRTVCSSIDKLDKLEWEEVAKELLTKGLWQETIDRMKPFFIISGHNFLQCSQDLMNLASKINKESKLFNEGLNELNTLAKYLNYFGERITSKTCFYSSLARGLDYYTGTIFEAVFSDSSYGIGSIGGGGSYDNLCGMFSNKSIRAVGFSIGIERILEIYKRKAQTSTYNKFQKVMVLVAGAGKVSTVKYRLEMLALLRENGISAETLYYEAPSMKQQIEYVTDNQIPYMIIIGEDEYNADPKVANLKHVESKKESTLKWTEIIEILRHNYI
jgi:histidyl-tRNA synthetase